MEETKLELAFFQDRVKRGTLVNFSQRVSYYGHEEVHRSMLHYDRYGHEHLVDLWVDIDNPDDRILDDLKYRLKNIGAQHEIYFSGHGYHINLQDLWNFTAEDFRDGTVGSTVSHYFPMADIARYRPRALIRLENTYNRKRKAWKVKLPQLLPPEEAYELAQEPPQSPVPSLVFEKLERLPKQKQERKEGPVIVPGEKKFWPKCMANIWNEGPARGKRHQNVLLLAAFLRRQGFSVQETEALLSVWLQPDPLPESELSNILSHVFEKGYNYGCSSPELVPYCELPCPYRNFKNAEESSLYAYATVHWQNRVSLKPVLGVDAEILPGELVVIQGMPGTYKSLVAQWLTYELGVNTVYISMDMPPVLTKRRYLQMITKTTKHEVIAAIADRRVSEEDIPAHVVEPLLTTKNFLETIHSLVLEYKPLVVIIDHLGLITAGDKNIADLMAERSRLLAKAAHDWNLIVLAIDHVSRISLRNNDRGMTAGRNALTEAESSLMLTIEREGELLDGAEVVKLKTVKTRDTKPFEVRLRVIPERMQVTLYQL